MEKIAWYEQRNDRTNRIDEVLLDSSAKRIGIVIENPESYTNQVMALICLNIMSRWCRRISIEVTSDVACCIYNKTEYRLQELLKTTVEEVDPFGDFKFEKITPEICDIVLLIGNHRTFTEENKYWIASNNWVYGFGYDAKKSSLEESGLKDNPLGAAFAAISINSLIFSDYIGLSKNQTSENWGSLVDYKHSDSPNALSNSKMVTPLDIGDIWQVGAGAVGSSFDYVLSLIPLKGSLKIIDFDKVSIPNTSSSLVFSAADAFASVEKNKTCKKAFKETEIFNVDIYDGDYSSFIRQDHLEKNYPDCILCFANERNIWSTIQFNEPPIVLHATTSSNWGINFGRHIPFIDWCIVCRFKNVEHNHTPTCSKVTNVTPKAKEEKLGILPFLSAAAGCIVLGELIKMSQYQKEELLGNENFLQLSLKDIPNSKFLKLQMPTSPECPICSMQYASTYHPSFQKSKFFKYLP
jgi:hypothetical protein